MLCRISLHQSHSAGKFRFQSQNYTFCQPFSSAPGTNNFQHWQGGIWCPLHPKPFYWYSEVPVAITPAHYILLQLCLYKAACWYGHFATVPVTTPGGHDQRMNLVLRFGILRKRKLPASSQCWIFFSDIYRLNVGNQRRSGINQETVITVSIFTE